jgi:chaperonin GroEL
MSSIPSFSKKISVGKESRDAIYKGVKILTDLVGSTLGPGGRFICIKRTQHPMDVPFLTKDGKTVAESVFLADEFEDAGAAMVKDVSIQTCKEAGDGTTTAAVLAHSMFKQGLDAIEAGANPVLLKKGMDAAVQAAVEKLKAMAVPVSDEDVAKVAMISANGDKEMADLVSAAVIRAGKNGAVELSYSNTVETKIRVVDGCQLLSGWASPQFITDPRLEEALLENPYILIINKKLQSINEMVESKGGKKSMMEQISDQQRSLLIICDDVQGEALAQLAYNKVRGVLKVCAIRTPGYKDAGREILEDVAALTGATVITDDLGMKLSSIGFEHLGQAGMVKVGQQVTTILDGKPDPARLAARIEGIQMAQQRETDQAEIERLQLRLSHISGGVVTIMVGGKTELEVREKFYRAEDAMHAVQVAREQGTLPGGGVALVRAAEPIPVEAEPTDYQKGMEIVKRAMMEPIQKISLNAGYDPKEVLVKVAFKELNLGFNAQSGQYGDLREMGVIDPLKVVLSALTSAESIASNMLLTEGMIVPPSAS